MKIKYPILFIIFLGIIIFILPQASQGAIDCCYHECRLTEPARCDGTWVQECKTGTICDIDPYNDWCNKVNCAASGKVCQNGVCVGSSCALNCPTGPGCLNSLTNGQIASGECCGSGRCYECQAGYIWDSVNRVCKASAIPACSDGTLYNQCSNSAIKGKPWYCNSSGGLIENSGSCGCRNNWVSGPAGTYCCDNQCNGICSKSGCTSAQDPDCGSAGCCGDNACNNGETNATCPADCAIITCATFTYSAWSACQSGSQTRTVLTRSPASCTGGTPITTQSCDSINPTVVSFTAALVAGTVTATYTVTDNVALKRVELWRATYNAANCSETTKTGCVWLQIETLNVIGTSHSGNFIDTPAAGIFWYGIHAVDQAHNWAPEADTMTSKITVALAECTGINSDFVAHLSEQIDSRISQASPTTESRPMVFSPGLSLFENYYSTVGMSARAYLELPDENRPKSLTWNLDSWTQKLSPLDFTGVSAWTDWRNGSNFDNPIYQGGATLITPRHFLAATHMAIPVGATVTFIKSDGSADIKTVKGKEVIHGDITLEVLDEDVDSSIKKYPVMDVVTFMNLLSNDGSYGLSEAPIVVFNQGRKVVVRAYNTNKKFLDDFYHKKYSRRSGFSPALGGGDSGQPGFLIVNNEPILIFTNTRVDEGPSIGTFAKQINNAIKNLEIYSPGSDGYTVSVYNPSCFRQYPDRPAIINLSITSCVQGASTCHIKINGNNFTTKNNTVRFGTINLGSNFSSYNDGIAIDIPTNISQGIYDIVVSNGGGISNAKSFTITFDSAISCSVDADCYNGYCDFDLSRVKRCHNTANSCVYNQIGKETPNGAYACTADLQKKVLCNNAVWSSQTQCQNGCRFGSCLEDFYNSATRTFNLMPQRGYILTLPVNTGMKKISEVFADPPLNIQITLWDNQTKSWGNSALFEGYEWANGDIVIKPGEVFSIQVPASFASIITGEEFNSAVPLSIKGVGAYIGMPYCAAEYTASKLLREISAIDSRCVAVTTSNNGVDPIFYWSNVENSGITGIKQDFKILPFEGYYIQCAEGVDFTFTPACPTP